MRNSECWRMYFIISSCYHKYFGCICVEKSCTSTAMKETKIEAILYFRISADDRYFSLLCSLRLLRCVVWVFHCVCWLVNTFSTYWYIIISSLYWFWFDIELRFMQFAYQNKSKSSDDFFQSSFSVGFSLCSISNSDWQ